MRTIPLVGPFVGRNVVSGFKNGKPGVLQIRGVFQQRRGFGAAFAIGVDTMAQCIEDEGLPVIALRDAFLVR